MAAVDYFAIEEEIAEILRAQLPETPVSVEEEMEFKAEATPRVFVYMEGIESPAEMQRLRAGTQTRERLTFAIWCWTFAMQVDEAIKQRNKLLGEVKVALMKHRTLNEKVETSWLDGGVTPSARLPATAGFTAGAEVRLIAEVEVTTD